MDEAARAPLSDLAPPTAHEEGSTSPKSPRGRSTVKGGKGAARRSVSPLRNLKAPGYEAPPPPTDPAPPPPDGPTLASQVTVPADITQLATEPLPPVAGDRVASCMDGEGQEECTKEITGEVAQEESSATAVPCSDSADEPTADAALCVADNVGGGGGGGRGKDGGEGDSGTKTRRQKSPRGSRIGTMNSSLPQMFTTAGPAQPLRATHRIVNISTAKRKSRIEELIECERNYGRKLHVLEDVFMDPLSKSNIVTSMELSQIFANLSSLCALHSDVVAALSAITTKPPEEQNVGRVFLEHEKYLGAYQLYCDTLDGALDTATTLRRTNKQFSSFLEEALIDPLCHGISLETFLRRPIEHLFEYPRLFREILDETDADHSDYRTLSEASERLTAVVDRVKKDRALQANKEKLNELQNQTDGLPYKLPKPGRKHVKRTSVSVVMAGKSAEVEMDLFSDLLLLSKKKQKGGKPMKCVAWIPLHCVLIRDSVSGGDSSVFEIVRSDEQKIYQLVFPNEGAMLEAKRSIEVILNDILEARRQEHVKERERTMQAVRVHQKIVGQSLTHTISAELMKRQQEKPFGTVKKLKDSASASDFPPQRANTTAKELPKTPSTKPADRPASEPGMTPTRREFSSGAVTRKGFTRAPNSPARQRHHMSMAATTKAAIVPDKKRLEEVPEDLTMEEFLAKTNLKHIPDRPGVSARISYAQISSRNKTVTHLSTKTTRRRGGPRAAERE